MKTKKFKSVSFNNRKKQLCFVYTSGKKAVCHYSSFGIKNNITKAWIDKDTGNQSIGLEFHNGKTDYIPYDQPLSIISDTEYLLQHHIELIISHIKDAIRLRKISKKYLAQQLKTSENQIHRLLNPKILNKNLSQLYKILAYLDLEIDMRVTSAA